MVGRWQIVLNGWLWLFSGEQYNNIVRACVLCYCFATVMVVDGSLWLSDWRERDVCMCVGSNIARLNQGAVHGAEAADCGSGWREDGSSTVGAADPLHAWTGADESVSISQRRVRDAVRGRTVRRCCMYCFILLNNNNNSNNNNLRLLGLISNLAVNTVQHLPRRAGHNSRHAGQHYIQKGYKPAKLLPHMAHSDWINRTGLTSWAFTRWCDQHTSDKVVHYLIYRPRTDERLLTFCLLTVELHRVDQKTIHF